MKNLILTYIIALLETPGDAMPHGERMRLLHGAVELYLEECTQCTK